MKKSEYKELFRSMESPAGYDKKLRDKMDEVEEEFIKKELPDAMKSNQSEMIGSIYDEDVIEDFAEYLKRELAMVFVFLEECGLDSMLADWKLENFQEKAA